MTARGERARARTEPARPASAMLLYLARRLVGGGVLLAVVAAVTFLLVALAPGATALVLAGPGGGDAEYLEGLRERLGLDRPLAYQIAAYLAAVARGDLGFSFVQGRPVLDVILDRLPASLLLAGTALTLASLGGVLLGVVAAARPRARRPARRRARRASAPSRRGAARPGAGRG